MGRVLRSRKFLGYKLSQVSTYLLSIILTVALIIFPQAMNYRYIVYVITLTNVFATLAIGWNLLSGFMGLISLGHSFFFAFAGYGAAIASLNLGYPLPIAMVIGSILATLLGILVGLPSLKLRGHYFAIVTLVLPIIAAQITDATPQLGGHDGIFGLPRISDDVFIVYYASFLLLFIALAIVTFVIRSRLGIIFKAIKQDENTAMAVGIDVPRYKLYCLAISAFISGLAGGFYAFLNGVASPATYELEKASLPLLMTLLGGQSTILGPVIGAYLIQGIVESLRIQFFGIDFTRVRLLLYAVSAFAIYMFFPEGIIGLIRKIRIW